MAVPVSVSPPRSYRGTAVAPFDRLEEVFARVVAAEPANVALAIYHDGQQVVDLQTVSFGDQPRQLIFSVSKAVVALATARAAQQGRVDLDAPIADVWPAFRKESTRRVTTRQVLSHTSGLAAITSPITLDDLLAGRIEEVLEGEIPLWDPGTAHGYHAVTFGPLVNGFLARATGSDLRTHIRESLAEPLGLGLSLGVPIENQVGVSHLAVGDRGTPGTSSRAASPPSMVCNAARALSEDLTAWNRPDVLAQSWASSNVVAGASDLARLFAASIGDVDGVRLLNEDALKHLTSQQAAGIDRILGVHTRSGSGVQLPFPQLPLLGPGSFGHEGANGCAVVADPTNGVSVAYLTDTFPLLDGAAPGFLTLLPSIQHCLQYAD